MAKHRVTAATAASVAVAANTITKTDGDFSVTLPQVVNSGEMVRFECFHDPETCVLGYFETADQVITVKFSQDMDESEQIGITTVTFIAYQVCTTAFLH